MQLVSIIIICIIAMTALICLYQLNRVVQPFMKALASGERVPLGHIVGMKLRGTPVDLVIDAFIVLRKRQIETSLIRIEETYIANQIAIDSADDLVREVDATYPSDLAD